MSDHPTDARDPDGPMVRLLRSVGVDDVEIAEAAAHGHLELLCLEKLVLPDPQDRDLRDVTSVTGLAPELVRQLRRSLGFVEAEGPDRLYGDVDVEVLESIGALLDTGVVDADLVVQMARVIGSSTARIASALVDVLDPVVPDEDEEVGEDAVAGPTLADADRFAEFAPLIVPVLTQVIAYVWSRHVQVETRARMARDHAGAVRELSLIHI